MEFVNYLASNVPLFCLSFVVIYLAIRNFKIRTKESILFLVFTTIVLFLSVVVEREKYAQRIGDVVLGTVFTSLGYIFRPILLYVFILLANMEQKRSRLFYLLLASPLAVNSIIYIFPLFMNVEGLRTLVFYYQANGDGTASFIRGTFLNFSSHLFSGLYLAALIFVSTMRFHSKHRRDGLVLLLCVIFIIATVVTEMIVNRNDLLNIVCEICALINYIFITSVNTSKDALTNLYDRRTYYEDVSRYKDSINGIIQIDMNGLKYLNDNYGHSAGDEALEELATMFVESLNNDTMVAYRLSGDEFLILMYQGKKASLEETTALIRKRTEASNYSVAIGSFYYDNKDNSVTFESAMKIAEELMYQDKEKYYSSSDHVRRKR